MICDKLSHARRMGRPFSPMAETKKEAAALKAEARRRPWWRLSLTTWILIGLVLGGVLGKVSPTWGNRVYFLRDIFLNMIKSIIAPLVFSTLVVGIAGGGDLKRSAAWARRRCSILRS